MALAKSIKSATLTFGMVSVSVKLFIATDDKDISFNRLHECGNKVKQQNVCEACSCNVEFSEFLKGYEYSKGKYVVIDESDLANLPLPSKDTIEISSFVSADSIDPIYYEKAYCVQPEEAFKKAFALLVQTMATKEVVALAKVVIRTKERLCALRLRNGVMILQTLHNPDEIRSFQPEEPVQITEKELKMAAGLVDMMTSEFDPESLKDTYREALIQMVEAKLAGKAPEEAAEPVQKAAPSVDMMSLLEASVEKISKKTKAAV